MTTAITIFQNELLTKLQFKSSSKISSDALLFKTFKFFDLYNNGSLNKSDFFRAIAKCGVIVETQNLDEVFNHYSIYGDQKIHYKQFIQQIFYQQQSNTSNQSRISNQTQNQTYNKTQNQTQIYSNQSQKYKQSFAKKELTAQQLVQSIRKQLRRDGIIGLLAFSIKLKSMDAKKTHKINATKLKEGIVFLKDSQIKKIMGLLNSQPNGQINYAQLIYCLKGNIEPQRKALIQRTFQLLDQSKVGQVQIQKVSKSFNGTNKSQFNKCIELYCTFQGIDDGYFTDEDFSDFLQFLSFGFSSNQSFRDFILKGYFQVQDIKSNNSKRVRQFDRQSQNKIKIQNKSNYDFRKNKEEERSQTEQRQKRDNYQEVDIQDIRSKSRHSSRQHSNHQQFSNQKDVQSIVLRIKKRLASKGAKGFLAFEKALKNADTNSDNLINLEEFKNVVKDQRVDISAIQCKIVFEAFDQSNLGLIDYGALVYVLRGQVQQKRKVMVQRIWQRIKKGDKYTTFGHIKQMVNLRAHPDIQNGRRQEQDIIKQITETIVLIQHLNGTPRSEEISRQDFIEFLENMSISIAEDALFQIICNSFWKIELQGRVQNSYAGSRKLYDQKSNGYLMDHHRYTIKGGNSASNAPYGTFSEPTNYNTENKRL